jgi:hypothetical protein
VLIAISMQAEKASTLAYQKAKMSPLLEDVTNQEACIIVTLIAPCHLILIGKI